MRSHITWARQRVLFGFLLAAAVPSLSRAGTVSCGGHSAPSCDDCPQGNGAGWCNGDCVWLQGQCMLKAQSSDAIAAVATSETSYYAAPDSSTNKDFHVNVDASNAKCKMGDHESSKCAEAKMTHGTHVKGSGWAHLCTEVASLRADLPSYVVRLGEVYEARQTVSKQRSLLIREDQNESFWGSDLGNCSGRNGTGPWRLKVDFAAPAGSPAAYQKHHRVVLVFDSNWPASAPQIRFAGKIESIYTMPGEGKLHVNYANGLFWKRVQQAIGSEDVCMWRQSGGCASDGSNREPDNDQLCTQDISLGQSGFCDCNGDGTKNDHEPGYGCDKSPGTCAIACSEAETRKRQRSSGTSLTETSATLIKLPRYSLAFLLETMHRMLGEPLHSTDRAAWVKRANEFKESVQVVLKYKTHGHRHPPLFRIGGLPEEEMIDPDLLALIREVVLEPSRATARERLLQSGLVEEIMTDLVFSFRVFKPSFSAMLNDEIHHFYKSGLPARRPNSMNNYGIIVNDIGLEPLVFSLQDAVIQPLAAILLPEAGSELESHHAFTIRYRGGEDTHLDVHTDDSDVTFNVNVYENYTGAPLVFCGLNGAPNHRQFQREYQHQLGHAVLHLGRHRHGAEDITSGERTNLVVWSYSYNLRTSTANDKRHEREATSPHRRCVSYTHDRDFGRFRAWPEGKKERHLGRGWCPPRGKEYDGFVADIPDRQQQPSQQQPS